MQDSSVFWVESPAREGDLWWLDARIVICFWPWLTCYSLQQCQVDNESSGPCYAAEISRTLCCHCPTKTVFFSRSRFSLVSKKCCALL